MTLRGNHNKTEEDITGIHLCEKKSSTTALWELTQSICDCGETDGTGQDGLIEIKHRNTYLEFIWSNYMVQVVNLCIQIQIKSATGSC